MRRNSIFTKRWVKGSAVLVATAATLVFANPQQAIATPLKGVDSATVSQSASNVVDIDFADGIKGRITFLEDGIFRYNVDPKGEFPSTPRRAVSPTRLRSRLSRYLGHLQQAECDGCRQGRHYRDHRRKGDRDPGQGDWQDEYQVRRPCRGFRVRVPRP